MMMSLSAIVREVEVSKEQAVRLMLDGFTIGIRYGEDIGAEDYCCMERPPERHEDRCTKTREFWEAWSSMERYERRDGVRVRWYMPLMQ